MELAKKSNTLAAKFKAVIMILVALTISTIWTLAFTQSAHARGGVAVAARAAPAVSVARSTPVTVRSTSTTRRAPAVTPVTNPALYPKSSKKNCNLEQNKNSKECIAKQKR